MRAAEGCRFEHLRGGGGLEIAARNLAEIGRITHLQNHVARIGVGAERNVHPRRTIGLPIVEKAPASRDVDRTMRNRAAVLTQDRKVVRARIVHQRIVTGEVAVADIELVRYQADFAQELNRRHLMFANDVEHLVDIVGRVDRDRQIARSRRLGSLAHQRHGAGFDLARHHDAADAIAVRALVAVDEFKREIEFTFARGLIRNTHELASFTTDPAAAVKARTEISADAELPNNLKQRLLDPQLASKLDKRCDAVANELRDHEPGIKEQLIRDRAVVGAEIARIAADARTLAGNAYLQERLAEIVPTSNVSDQPVRGAVPGMHMGVDESWHN